MSQQPDPSPDPTRPFDEPAAAHTWEPASDSSPVGADDAAHDAARDAAHNALPPSPGQPYHSPAPAYPAPTYSAPASGTAPTPALSEHDERVWSLAAHLLVFVGGFLAPLVIWLVFRGRSDFLEHHAKEALNFQITVLLAGGLFLIMILAFIGYLFLLLLAIAAVALPIIAAARAHSGDWFRYPVALRLVK